MAVVGQQLAAPESGWKRYDNTCGLFKYTGAWTDRRSTNTTSLDNSDHTTSTVGNSITFKFVGTAVRFIGCLWSGYSSNIEVDLDGVKETISQSSGTNTKAVLNYEKLGLTDSIHTLTITLKSSGSMVVNAVDIPAEGRPLTWWGSEVRTKVRDMQVGDVISCEYTSFGNTLGWFTRLGNADKPMISTDLNPQDYTDGSFYFIHCGFDTQGKPKLVADRQLRYYITWDALNSAGVCNTAGYLSSTQVRDFVPAFTSNPQFGFNVTHSSALTNEEGWRAFSGAWGFYAPANIVIDCGTPKIYNRLSIAPQSGTEANMASNLYLEGSNDSTNWTELKQVTETSWAPNVYKSYTVESSGYRYYRVRVTSQLPGGGACRIKLKLENYDTFSTDLSIKPSMRLISYNEWANTVKANDLKGKITAGDTAVWNINSYAQWLLDGDTARTTRYTVVNTAYTLQAPSTYTSIGFRPMLVVEYLNMPPTINLTVDREVTFNSVINMSADIADVDGTNQINWRLLLNGTSISDWSGLLASPVSLTRAINVSQLNSGINTLVVEAKDDKNALTTSSITLYRKSIDSTYLEGSVNKDKSLTIKVQPSYIAFVKVPDLVRAKGYIRSASLTVDMVNGGGSGGTVKVAPIITDWQSYNVTISNQPSVDISRAHDVVIPINNGIVSFDITNVAKAARDLGVCYGFAIYTTEYPIEFSVLGITVGYTYQSTLLNQPQSVYGNRVNITWRPLVLERTEVFTRQRLLRSTSSDFSNPTTVFDTANRTVTSYEDKSVSKGTFYYRVEVDQLDLPDSRTKLDFDLSDESGFIQQDQSKTEFIDGMLRLTKVNALSVVENFDNASGITYDNTKATVASSKISLNTAGTSTTVELNAIPTTGRVGVTSIVVNDVTSNVDANVEYNFVDNGVLGSGKLFTYDILSRRIKQLNVV